MATLPLSKGRSFVGACVFSLLALGFLWGTGYYANAVRKSYVAADWPVSQGTVVSSAAVEGCGKGHSYFPRVRYQYAVDGTVYQGTRIAFGNGGCGSFASAREIANRYAVNSGISVHYDPVSPSESVLVTAGVLSETWLGIAVLTGVFAISVWLASKYMRA